MDQGTENSGATSPHDYRNRNPNWRDESGFLTGKFSGRYFAIADTVNGDGDYAESDYPLQVAGTYFCIKSAASSIPNIATDKTTPCMPRAIRSTKTMPAKSRETVLPILGRVVQ